MMKDWDADDRNLLGWREATSETAFEQATADAGGEISEQEYFDNGVLMVAMVKAGVELAFEMHGRGRASSAESAYYESLHETPLIANLISRKKLYEMNKVISDTAEYGCYLFATPPCRCSRTSCASIDTDVIGKGLGGRPAGRQPGADRGERGDPQTTRSRSSVARCVAHDGDEEDRLKPWVRIHPDNCLMWVAGFIRTTADPHALVRMNSDLQ